MKTLLLDTLRGLRYRRGATAVAVGGLTLALAACLLVGLLAIALADVDPGIAEPERVVLLDFKNNRPGEPGAWATASPIAFAEMLKERKVPLNLISRATGDGLDVRLGDRIQPLYVQVADPDLVPLFGLKTLHGDLRATLMQRDGIALTAGSVRKLWGELPPEQALNRQIESRGRFFRVTAVIPDIDPRNPLGAHDAWVGFESSAYVTPMDDRQSINMVNGQVFARLRPDASAEQVGSWMRDAFKASPRYAALPPEWTTGREAAYFRGVPLPRLPFEGGGQEQRWKLMGAVGAATALLLLMAAFNHMNLQVAALLQRQRETALRRSLGADGWHLLTLWALDALLPLLLSAAIALILAWWVAPMVATWMGLSPTQPIADPIPLRALLGLAVSVMLLLPATLAWPAWMALRRAPAPALQGRTASEGPSGRRVRQGLLTLQLLGALLLLAMAGVMAVQQQHILHADQGFDTHNRLWVGIMSDPQNMPPMGDFVAAMQQHPAITHWAFSGGRPARDTQGETDLNVSPTQHKQVLRVTRVSTGFFETWGMTLLAGTPRTGNGGANVVIDAKAARLLGFASPQAAVGAVLRGGGGSFKEGTEERRIVAVVKDVKLESARDHALPQAFLLIDEPQWDLTVYGPDLAALRQAVEDVWKAHGPPVPHEVQTADEQRADIYRLEAQLTTILITVSLLAMGVAMLGAYALVADTLRRRRTELVLRRLHGAGNLAIARHVATEFAIPWLIAVLVGLPLAAWLGQQYLDGFVEREGVGFGLVVPLALAGVLTIFTTALSALRHVRQALALQPIEALQ